jgi:hypothetical protein
MSTVSKILMLVWALNGLHCIILSWIVRNVLVKIGKREKITGIGTPLDIIDFYISIRSDLKVNKYRGLLYQVVIADLAQVFLTVLILWLLT